jgi:two-component system, OmpR family, phosphate regulon response regulator PhoB
MKILIVEDDPDMLVLLKRLVKMDGYEPIVASDLSEGLRAATVYHPDLVLLDVMLGHEDGRTLLPALRRKSDVPVVFLTGRALETDRIAGLRMGADDYIVKPFSIAELSARIESVLRRCKGAASGDRPPAEVEHGDLCIDLLARQIRLGHIPLEFTSTEFDLLAFLALSPRQVFSRTQLLENVWSESCEWPTEATVTEYIRRVRRKIEVDPYEPQWIVTVRNVGYRFEPLLPAY